MIADQRTAEFTLWKGGAPMPATFRGAAEFRAADAVEPLDRRRVFAVDTESLSTEAGLKTLLVPVRYWDASESIACPDGRGMLGKLLASVFARGWAVPEGPPSRSKSRGGAKSKLPGGRRALPDPVLSVWFNLPYDFGRLCADHRALLRGVAAGAEVVKARVGEFEVEVVRMHFGSSSAFEWLVRRPSDRTILRLLGLDLTGYWKTTLAGAAKAAGVAEKVDIEASIENVYERKREEFTDEEWAQFEAYGLGDVTTTLELYHATVTLLTTVDARVVKRTGVVPSSAPGAAAKIVFAKAFDCHPDIASWRRYPAWADQLGCDSYFGGRSFCRRRGVFQRMKSLDIKSAYPFQTALLPDPVTVKMRMVREARGFDTESYRGKYGVLTVSGEGLDDEVPAFRVHDPLHHGRLRYVVGRFARRAVTIPELVIGVLRGALRVDRVHSGVVMEGSAESSFLRAGMLAFFSLKEDQALEKALRDMAKLLMNSTYGKLIEVQCAEYVVAEKIPVPPLANRREVAATLAHVYANGDLPEGGGYLGVADAQRRAAEAIFRDRMSDSVALPVDLQGPHAVASYLEAMSLSGAPLEPGGRTRGVGDFLREHRRAKCGQYFMPLYAAQITGATSAMLGLMAAKLGAYQGDTDSVHVALPDGCERLTEIPGVSEYFRVMTEAGYPSPRKRVDGTYAGGVEGMPSLGSWMEETDRPSEESVLVRPKVYSHRFPVGTTDGSKPVTYKQAQHGFSKFHTPEIEAALRDASLPREERVKGARAIRARTIHSYMRSMLDGAPMEYDTRRAPRRLRESVRGGLEVGEFVSRRVTLRAGGDPNTTVDEGGWVRWRGMNEE